MSEARLRNLIEHAPFPIIIVRIKDGSMRYGNMRAQSQLGFTHGQGIGLQSSEFYQNPADRAVFLDLFNRQGHVYDYELQLLNWERKPYWALMSASQVDFEGEPSIMVSINDITIRKQAEFDLQHEHWLLVERLKERACRENGYYDLVRRKSFAGPAVFVPDSSGRTWLAISRDLTSANQFGDRTTRATGFIKRPGCSLPKNV
jgi:PAS domain S-box-containing protein